MIGWRFARDKLALLSIEGTAREHFCIMVASTIIARVADGLPLAASMDDEEVYLI